MDKADSWTVLPRGEIVKKIDKSALIHKGTAVPKRMRTFFETGEMPPGGKREIIFNHEGKGYKAKLTMESIETSRTRLFWNSEFEEVLKAVFCDEYQGVLEGKEIGKDNKSAIIFYKVTKDEYIVKLRNDTYSNKRSKEDLGLYNSEGIDALSLLYREFQDKVSKAFKVSRQLRVSRLKRAFKVPRSQNITTKIYVRNPDVVAEVLYRAKGKCERCGGPAPFKRATDGTAYLEVHHKKQLADGGEDTIENAIATCPNCHRELHYGVPQKIEPMQ